MSGIKSQKMGEFGEQIAQYALKEFGLRMIERVNTPWKIIWKKNSNGVNIPARVFPAAKVSGDFRAIGPAGKSVLIEVKYRENSLVYSDLEDHQIRALHEHTIHGGLSFLLWITQNLWMIYDWSEMPLKKGGPAIKPGEKQGLQMMRNY